MALEMGLRIRSNRHDTGRANDIQMLGAFAQFERTMLKADW